MSLHLRFTLALPVTLVSGVVLPTDLAGGGGGGGGGDLEDWSELKGWEGSGVVGRRVLSFLPV